MNSILNYIIYIIIYGYLFLLFLKGYYPANETGILFIGFLIFMTLAYTFVGSLLTDELNLRRKEIYNRFESLLENSYNSLYLLKDLYVNILNYKGHIEKTLALYPSILQNSIVDKLNTEFNKNLSYTINMQLISIVKSQIIAAQNSSNIAYLAAVKQLIESKKSN